MMKLNKGQTVAVCVKYPNTSGLSFIIAKFEKKLANGKFVVRDEFSDIPKYDRYTVEANRIIAFPNVNQKYSPGDDIIALWYDQEDHEWSTMLYPAKVVEIGLSHQVVIRYKQGVNTNITIDETKISKLPDGFADSVEEDEDGELHLKAEEEKSDERSEESQEKQVESPQEERRINFMADRQVAQKERVDFHPLTDDEFNKLAGPRPKPRKMECKKGTPLIDFLQDPTMFPSDSPHITGNGLLRRRFPKQEEPTSPPGVLDPKINCGRLSKIFHDWRPY